MLESDTCFGCGELPIGLGVVGVSRDLIQPNFNVFAIVGIGLLCAFVSLSLFSKAGSITAQVIPPQDRHLLEPLIKGPNRTRLVEPPAHHGREGCSSGRETSPLEHEWKVDLGFADRLEAARRIALLDYPRWRGTVGADGAP